MNYIVDFKPVIMDDIDYDYMSNIEQKIKNNISLNLEETTNFLDTLCFILRYKVNDNMDNFLNKCDTFQAMFYYYFKSLNVKFIPCMTQNVITNNIIGHSFSIIELLVENEKKLFLLDPSYIQFFEKDKCSLNNYVVAPQNKDYILLTPNPGYFIHETDKTLVNEFLNRGYSFLSSDLARIYGDSFLNTKTGLVSKNFKNIKGNIYINSFLKGNEPISKTKEELENLDLFVSSFEVMKDNQKHQF